MTKAEEYRHGAEVTRKLYVNMPNGPERRKLWQKEKDLILKAQAEEAKGPTREPVQLELY